MAIEIQPRTRVPLKILPLEMSLSKVSTSPNLEEFVVEQLINDPDVENVSDDDTEVVDAEPTKPTARECFEAIRVLKRKIQFDGLTCSNELEQVEIEVSKSVANGKKQAIITDFFS